MADVRIFDLTVASPLTGTEIFEAEQDGHAESVKVTTTQILDAGQARYDTRYSTPTQLAIGLATKAAIGHTHTIAQVAGLQAALDSLAGGTGSGATTHIVADEAAMLAVTGAKGDIAIRTDITKTFILAAIPASDINNWKMILSATNTFLVSSEAAQLALSASKGDIAIRTDISQSYILADTPASTLENWYILSSTSSFTGTTDDIDEGAINKYFTEARARAAAVAHSITSGVTNVAPSQDAVFNALAGKQNINSYLTNIANLTGLEDGSILEYETVDDEFKATISPRNLRLDGGNF